MTPAEPDDRDGDDDEFDDGEAQTEVVIEVSGLSLYTHHGVSEAEREIGQRLVIDLRLEVGEVDATVTDMVEDTVDYGAVCQAVALVAQQRSYRTLERLCAAIGRGYHGGRHLRRDRQPDGAGARAEIEHAWPRPPAGFRVQHIEDALHEPFSLGPRNQYAGIHEQVERAECGVAGDVLHRLPRHATAQPGLEAIGLRA